MSLFLALMALGGAVSPNDDSAYSLKETRMVVDDYGHCIVAKEPKLASEAILRNVDNGTLMHDYPRLIDGRCMPTPPGTTVKVKFHGDQFRYALADALVRRELAAVPMPPLTGVPALDQRIPTPPARADSKGRPLSERKYADALQDYQDKEAFTYLSQYGECVVRADPADARALLLAKPESDGEKASFAALNGALGNCLEEGRTMALGKVALRGTIAVNYYRLAHAAAAVPGGAAQ
jgi:hypothetical protein